MQIFEKLKNINNYAPKIRLIHMTTRFDNSSKDKRNDIVESVNRTRFK